MTIYFLQRHRNLRLEGGAPSRGRKVQMPRVTIYFLQCHCNSFTVAGLAALAEQQLIAEIEGMSEVEVLAEVG